jgi:hypothetical protein
MSPLHTFLSTFCLSHKHKHTHTPTHPHTHTHSLSLSFCLSQYCLLAVHLCSLSPCLALSLISLKHSNTFAHLSVAWEGKNQCKLFNLWKTFHPLLWYWSANMFIHYRNVGNRLISKIVKQFSISLVSFKDIFPRESEWYFWNWNCLTNFEDLFTSPSIKTTNWKTLKKIFSSKFPLKVPLFNLLYFLKSSSLRSWCRIQRTSFLS